MNANAMLLFAALSGLLLAQDPVAAARKYAEGDFPGALSDYEKAAAADPGVPEWQYDRALSAFRAGDLDTAVDAIERYAAMPGGGRADLHHGLLGNVRFAEAKALQQAAIGASRATPPAAEAKPADPVALLESAVQKAKTARDAFVRAAAEPLAAPALARNAERSVRLLRELEQQLQEAKKQREQQQGDSKDESKPDDQSKDGEKKPDDQSKDGDQGDPSQREPSSDAKESKDDPSRPEPDSGEPKPEPEQAEGRDEAKPTPQPTDGGPEQAKDGEQEPEPQAAESDPAKEPEATPRGDAPGELSGTTELTPEQRQRLLEQLQKQDARLKRIRAATPRGRRPVERDW